MGTLDNPGDVNPNDGEHEPRRLPHKSYRKAYPAAKAATLEQVREAGLRHADEVTRWRLGGPWKDVNEPLPGDLKWNDARMSSSGCVSGGSLTPYWPVWDYWCDHKGLAIYSDEPGRNSGNPEILMSWSEVYRHLRGEVYEQVELELFA